MISIVRKSVRAAKRAIQDREDKKFLAPNPLIDDVYLVSFPKSGNHWLRFLIANAIKTHFEIDREVNFFTIDGIIPNIHVKSGALRECGPFGRPDLPRIIKSHRTYTPHYNRVILLVRDPRDVMVSHYHFLKDRQLIDQGTSLSQFVRHPNHGAPAWATHTLGWYSTFEPGQNIQLFRYEDFLERPQYQLARLMSLLGIPVNQAALEEAVDLSSKQNMKKSGNVHRSVVVTQILEAPLVRQAMATQGRELDPSDRQYIEETTRDVARMVGYHY